MKQPQPQVNAESSNDESGKTPKARLMNADPPQGPTGSKRIMPGAVGRDPVKLKAPEQGAKAASQSGSEGNAPTEEAPDRGWRSSRRSDATH